MPDLKRLVKKEPGRNSGLLKLQLVQRTGKGENSRLRQQVALRWNATVERLIEKP